MISRKTIAELEKRVPKISYLLGALMRRVKEVWVEDRRYIVCVNAEQAKKDAADREAILASLRDQLRQALCPTHRHARGGRKGLPGHRRCPAPARLPMAQCTFSHGSTATRQGRHYVVTRPNRPA